MDILKNYKEKGFATSHLEKKLAEIGQVLNDDILSAPKPDWNAPEFKYSDDESEITGPSKMVVIDGHIAEVPILSENAKGIKNKVMCPACARYKKMKKCTGAIPTCDQCLNRGLDAEMCTSKYTIKEIKDRRDKEDQDFYGDKYVKAKPATRLTFGPCLGLGKGKMYWDKVRRGLDLNEEEVDYEFGTDYGEESDRDRGEETDHGEEIDHGEETDREEETD